MRARLLTAAGFVLLSVVSLTARATMTQIRLTEGVDDVNRLTQPVIDASQTAPLMIGPFASAFDKKPNFVRTGGGNMFTKGPEYKLDPKVDVGALFTEALNAQAAAMGFKIVKNADGAWSISGALKNAYVESRQIPYGATLFYGFLEVDVQIVSPTGAKTTASMRLHNFFGGYNAGMGRKDEAEGGAAHTLVEGAQEFLARLNRMQIKAPPHASIAARLAAVQAGPLDPHRADLRAVSLSGLPAATPALLALLSKEASESGRSSIIDALAALGSPEGVSTLAGRYTTEDEDPRWYTLKAMDYIGSADALKMVATTGRADKDVGPSRLAQRISGAK